jgi:hypothetical protein
LRHFLGLSEEAFMKIQETSDFFLHEDPADDDEEDDEDDKDVRAVDLRRRRDSPARRNSYR